MIAFRRLKARAARKAATAAAMWNAGGMKITNVSQLISSGAFPMLIITDQKKTPHHKQSDEPQDAAEHSPGKDVAETRYQER
jgi:hypothetical protein